MIQQAPETIALRQGLVRALQFRHACRVFDETRSISRPDLDYVLEAGRLAPSALGLEPWRFIAVRDPLLRRHLRPACWNQTQITTSSVVIIILALKAELAPETAYTRKMLSRLVRSDAELTETLQIHRDMARVYQQIAHGDPVGWSIAQCHIAAANMMIAAAAIGIDSCPMAGFEPEAAAEVLTIDRSRCEIALLLALGYRAHPQSTRHRLTLDELVEYR